MSLAVHKCRELSKTKPGADTGVIWRHSLEIAQRNILVGEREGEGMKQTPHYGAVTGCFTVSNLHYAFMHFHKAWVGNCPHWSIWTLSAHNRLLPITSYQPGGNCVIEHEVLCNNIQITMEKGTQVFIFLSHIGLMWALKY